MNRAFFTAIPCEKQTKEDKAIYLNTIKDNIRKDKNQKHNTTKNISATDQVIGQLIKQSQQASFNLYKQNYRI